MKHLTLKPAQFLIGQNVVVVAPELVREQMSAKSVSEAMGADSDYVLREIAEISKQVQIVRAELADNDGVRDNATSQEEE